MRWMCIILTLTNIFFKVSTCFWIFGKNELSTEQKAICNKVTFIFIFVIRSENNSIYSFVCLMKLKKNELFLTNNLNEFNYENNVNQILLNNFFGELL